MEKNRFRASMEMTIAMAISGTVGWFVVSANLPLPSLLFWRCVFGALSLALACAWLKLFQFWPDRVSLCWAAGGGIAIVLNWWMLFASYSYTSISIATAVYHAQPFILVLLSSLFLKEKLERSKIAWMLVAFAGVALIVLDKPGGASGESHVLGVALALAAAVLYALAGFAVRRLKTTPPHLIALIQCCVGIVLTFPAAKILPLAADARTWAFYGGMGILYTGVVYILLYGALQKLPTTVSGILSFIYPITTVVVDYFAFERLPSNVQISGMLVILGSVAASNNKALSDWLNRFLPRKA